jgi:phosphoglycolate phosphatase-like HAD superfamily hydrolase
MGVVTNKAGRFTEPLLELTGLRRYFGVVVSGDRPCPRKGFATTSARAW